MKIIVILLIAFSIHLSGPMPAASSEDPFCFADAADMYSVPEEMLQAISSWETGHNQSTVHWNENGTYDYGHMGINSHWYRVLGPELWDSLASPCQNTKTGAWVLAQCIQRYGCNWRAIGCYNAGGRESRETLRIKYAWNIYRTLGKIEKNTSAGAKSKARSCVSSGQAEQQKCIVH